MLCLPHWYHKHKLTFDVKRVIDDKVSIPNHRQVHWQVADVIALIGILKYETATKIESIIAHRNLKQYSSDTNNIIIGLVYVFQYSITFVREKNPNSVLLVAHSNVIPCSAPTVEGP